MFHIVFACAAIALLLVCLILTLAAPGLGTLVSVFMFGGLACIGGALLPI